MSDIHPRVNEGHRGLNRTHDKHIKTNNTMGTRNLTMVIDQEGVKKVAQYGQWDGYPSGVGADILDFLKDKGLFEKFKLNLHKVRFLDVEGIDKEFVKSFNDKIKRTQQQEEWYNTYCHRDLAAKILTNIANSTDENIILQDREETGKGDGWVEYCYVINLKENTLGVYTHVDREAIKVYKLDELPTEEDFVEELEELED